MRIELLRAFVAVAIFLFAAADLPGQPLFPATRSIETIVANSDLVVVAKLVEIRLDEQAPQHRGLDILVDVEETLKQDLFTIDPYEGLGVRVSQPLAEVQEWKRRGSRLLIAHDDHAPDEATILELADGRMEVLTADLKLLRDPEKVLQVAKETAQRAPAAVKRIHTFPLAVPREVIVGTKWETYYGSSGYLRLSVPVDQRLEKRAIDYLGSDSYQQRYEGVRALRYFKSDDNIARVKSLLGDPHWGHLKDADENGGVEVRWYGVRDEAFRTVRAWGVDMEKPVVREEVRIE
jgi:hypothetical protein